MTDYLSGVQYREYATYQREYDELSDTNEPYGVHFIDGDTIIDTFWFATEEESEKMIDEFYKANNKE